MSEQNNGKEKNDGLSEKMPADPVRKKYSIIYADPPWAYRVWSEKGRGRSAENHYRTQPMEFLKTMKVEELAADDCVLLLWAAYPCLKEALALGEAWGFTYKTVAFTWVKLNKNSGSLFVGLGYYTRSNAEIVLLFTKGKPLKRVSKNVAQVLIAKVGPHSQKPAEIRERIVQLYGDLPRIELFARSRAGFFPDCEYAGWDVLGDEANHSIQLK